MSWTEPPREGRVEIMAAEKRELDGLRSIVKEKIHDAAAAAEAGLSADTRFTLAYDAARTLALIIVRASGRRPKGVGAHAGTFAALALADPAFTAMSDYFDSCREKRNTSEYDYAGGVTDTEADELLKTAKQFAKDAEAWVAANHPHLA